MEEEKDNFTIVIAGNGISFLFLIIIIIIINEISTEINDQYSNEMNIARITVANFINQSITISNNGNFLLLNIISIINVDYYSY